MAVATSSSVCPAESLSTAGAEFSAACKHLWVGLATCTLSLALPVTPVSFSGGAAQV